MAGGEDHESFFSSPAKKSGSLANLQRRSTGQDKNKYVGR